MVILREFGIACLKLCPNSVFDKYTFILHVFSHPVIENVYEASVVPQVQGSAKFAAMHKMYVLGWPLAFFIYPVRIALSL